MSKCFSFFVFFLNITLWILKFLHFLLAHVNSLFFKFINKCQTNFEVCPIFFTCVWFFGYLGKQFDKKAKVNSRLYDVTDWTKNNGNSYIAQNLKKQRQPYNELQLIEYTLKKYFYRKIMQKMRQAD